MGNYENIGISNHRPHNSLCPITSLTSPRTARVASFDGGCAWHQTLLGWVYMFNYIYRKSPLLGSRTTRPVDSSARSGQLGPYLPDNLARRFNYTECLSREKTNKILVIYCLFEVILSYLWNKSFIYLLGVFISTSSGIIKSLDHTEYTLINFFFKKCHIHRRSYYHLKQKSFI